jgi:hypothetical protein
MKTQNIPQIVLDAIAKDFKNPYVKAYFTQTNVIMASALSLCIYYVMNQDNTQIIDIQVD